MLMCVIVLRQCVFCLLCWLLLRMVTSLPIKLLTLGGTVKGTATPSALELLLLLMLMML